MGSGLPIRFAYRTTKHRPNGTTCSSVMLQRLLVNLSDARLYYAERMLHTFDGLRDGCNHLRVRSCLKHLLEIHVEIGDRFSFQCAQSAQVVADLEELVRQ